MRRIVDLLLDQQIVIDILHKEDKSENVISDR